MFEEAKETQPLSTLWEIENCKVPKEKVIRLLFWLVTELLRQGSGMLIVNRID